MVGLRNILTSTVRCNNTLPRDYTAMISEIILFSYGYLRARECARKIVSCYK